MRITSWMFLVILGLLLVSCGGEPPSGDPDDGDGCPGGSCANDDGNNESAGTLVVTTEPAIAGAPPLQVWECTLRGEISRRCEGDEFMLAEGELTGEAIRVSLSEGTHHVRFNIPGYGYSVAGYEFLETGPAHPNRFTVADWIMDLEISPGAELAIHAIICRDFTEEIWYRFNNLDDDFETGLDAEVGRCWTFGMSGGDFEVRANMLITSAAWGSCAGIEAPVENDQHFEVDCPTGSHHEYNRLVE